MMRSSWTRRLAAALSSLLLLLASCESNEAAPPSGLTPVRVGIFSSGSTLPVHAAVVKKIFERNGLAVELTEGQDLPVFMAALAKGQYDIAMSGPTLMLIGAEKKLNLEIVSSMQHSTREQPNAVWIARDPAITSLMQLKGKTIGVPSLTGTIVDAVVYLLSRAGMARNQVKFVQTPFPTMGDQLVAGNVDAVVASIPFSGNITARGFTPRADVIVEAVMAASDGLIQSAMTSVWASTRSFADAHSDTVRAWRTSLEQAIAYLDADEPRARAMMQDWLKIPPAVLERSALPDWSVAVTPEALAPYVTISRAAGSITAEPDVNSLVWHPR
jgi:NitT/TauT family transport system substrate-binding protein